MWTYQNGRIDNIFTDAYYDPFTSALHEVVKDFKLPVSYQILSDFWWWTGTYYQDHTNVDFVSFSDKLLIIVLWI